MIMNSNYLFIGNVAIKYSEIMAVELTKDVIYIYVSGVNFPFNVAYEDGHLAQDSYDQLVDILKEREKKNNEKS